MEQVNFSYDLDFILETGVSILLEPIICTKGRSLEINGHEYIKHNIINKYNDELDNKTFIKKIKEILENDYPEGCLIPKKVLEGIANTYLKYLIEGEIETFGNIEGRNGFVESKFLKKRIYCRQANHFDASLVLASFYFGMSDLVSGNYTFDDLISYIKYDIEVNSTYTSKDMIIQRLESDKNWGYNLSTIFSTLRHEHFSISNELVDI